jgi:vancomycin resistance protein YoaR
LLLFAPALLVVVGCFFLGARARVPDSQIVPGVHVAGLDLGHKQIDEARSALKQWADSRQATVFTLHFTRDTGATKFWKTDARTLGLGIDVDATLDDVTRTGRSGLIDQIATLLKGGHTIPVAPHVTVDDARLSAYLHQIARHADRKPINARLSLLRGGGFGLHHERPGFGIDQDAARTAITQAWTRINSADAPAAATATPPAPANPGAPAPSPDEQTHAKADQAASAPPHEGSAPAASGTPPADSTASGASDLTPPAADVELPGHPTQPKVTYALLSQIDGELGGFATTYAVGDRGDNIHLATSHINGTLLLPGDVFSYNRVVGPRVESAGFKQAPVIIHGQLKPGIGGGICQVSSTLFNAVLKSDLKIVQRSHHAFPVHYLPPGRDATVVDGALDFKFQNNTPAPVYVSAYAHGGVLSFALFGKRTPGRTVSLVQGRKTVGDIPTDTETDPTLPAGRRTIKEPGHPDINVTWYRVVRENGQVVSREPIHTHYTAIAETVLVGTKPRRPKAPRPLAPTTIPATPATSATAPPVAPDTQRSQQ